MAVLLGSTVARPWINVSEDGGFAEGHLAYEALEADRNQEAFGWLRDATTMQPHNATFWYDLGIACDRLQRYSEAAAAFRRAQALDPLNPDYRAAAQQRDDSPP